MGKQPSVRVASPRQLTSELVVIGCFKGRAPDTSRLPSGLTNAAGRAVERSGWKGKEKQIARAQSRSKQPSQVVVHGLGRAADFGSRELARWSAKAVQTAADEGYRDLLLVLPDHPAVKGRAAFRLLVDLGLSGYRFDRFQSKTSRSRLRTIRVLPPAGEDASYKAMLKVANKVVPAVAFGRDLANTPPNEANPEWMAGEAGRLAKTRSMKIKVLGPKELTRMGMGGILAVGGGSSSPPRLVRLEWGSGSQTISFVGKGVTFDTGGISIKPAGGMDEMKYDKSGACTVLGIAQAAADLELPFHFRAYLPLAENMPDGMSYRPGDIVRCYNGKTVEVLNTDAEGRMILADALSWAAEEEPGTLLEYSTLTGASVVAIGHHAASLYTPDDYLAAELLDAAEDSNERLWRMPLWPEYREEMKGTHADLRNVAGRWGGANTAAAFLSQFVGKTERWAHLDIAATAYVAGDQKGTKGATGYGVALTSAWLLELANRF
ncbi:MAG: leucyl aminopeptidase [Acidobacteria bacterium]|nr:MAG: leucyl aminopeptidase [Acidobacteriota bacterium]